MKSLQNNWFILLISIVISVIIWVMVMNTVKPLITDYIEVPISINDNTENNEKTYKILGDGKVRFNYRVRSDMANAIKQSGIKAYIVIQDTTNSVENLQVHYAFNDPNLEEEITNFSYSPQIVEVEISDFETKYFDLKEILKGNMKNNSIAGSLIKNPVGITIRGAKEDLDKINEARIEVDLENRTDTFTDKAVVKLYDVNNNEIERTENLFMSVGEVDYTIIAYTTKAIFFKPSVEGDVNNGCSFESVETNPPSIMVVGPKSSLDTYDSIDLPSVNINGLSESKVIDIYDINQFLPVGIQNISDVEKVEVKVNVSGSPRIIIAPKVPVEE